MSSFNPFFEELLKLSAKKTLVANLSVGEPFEPIPEAIKKGSLDSIIENQSRYSPAGGFFDLRIKLARKVTNKNSIKCSPEKVLVTSGVSGGYDLALFSILSPNEEIILLDPYFPPLLETSKILNFKVKLVKNLDEIASFLSAGTKAIVINSPNNPTGNVYSKEELVKLAQLAEKNNIFIISDEIYEDFVYEGEHFSIGSIYEKTITLFGFSKSYSMTGWRLGYNVAPKELVDKMIEIQRYLFYAPSTPAQYGAIEFDKVDINEKIKSFKEKRNFVLDNLNSKFIIKNKPVGAFYVFPALPVGLTGEEFAMKALDKGVLVFPGSLFSPEDSHFRISYSVGMEELKRGIEILNTLI